MKKTLFFFGAVLLAVACTPQLQPARKVSNFNEPVNRIFVRIVTPSKSYDTMTEVMSWIKILLLDRGHEMSGGIIALERYQLDAAAVEEKLAAFRPEGVLEIAPPDAGIRWTSIEKIPIDTAASTKPRYYLAVLSTVPEKRPVWTVGLFQPFGFGDVPARRMAQRTITQLEAAGMIRKK